MGRSRTMNEQNEKNERASSDLNLSFENDSFNVCELSTSLRLLGYRKSTK